MYRGTASTTESRNELLEPDKFWDVIEKLLLHSRHDEQSRLRHNTSLSALCCGYALSQLPRDKAQRYANSKTILKDSKKAKVSKVPKKNAEKKRPKNKEKELAEGNKRHVIVQKSRSECSVSDADIVFVKNSEIPASKRLWRFAIRNRRQRQDRESIEVLPKMIPGVRRNEAVFEGLKRKLENARVDDADNIIVGKCKQKPQKESHKQVQVRKHQCKSVANYYSSVNNKALRKQQKSTFSIRRSPTQALPKQKTAAEEAGHDLNRSHVQSLIKTNNSQNSSDASPVHFEAKKTLYDSVIKKRLTCGNKLEVLNREIINKKLNPRMVISRETTKKYMELKTDYLNLCYQESSLRHQIAILQSEIYMMQHKGFNKRLAAIKNISLDSKSASLPLIPNSNDVETKKDSNHHEKVLLFPRLKPPKPRILTQHKSVYNNYDHILPSRKSNNLIESSLASQKETSNVESARTSFPSILDNMSPNTLCTLYSLTTPLESPTVRQPPALLIPPKVEIEKGKTVHRLPRMDFAI